jgi:hypothetical protein
MRQVHGLGIMWHHAPHLDDRYQRHAASSKSQKPKGCEQFKKNRHDESLK